MADLLKKAPLDWWPIDKVILAYFGASSAVELYCGSRLPHPWEPQLVHLGGALLVLLAVHYPFGQLTFIFRHWYPVFYTFYCYKEMSWIIPALRSTDADAYRQRVVKNTSIARCLE